jgi:hypothetical protein
VLVFPNVRHDIDVGRMVLLFTNMGRASVSRGSDTPQTNKRKPQGSQKTRPVGACSVSRLWAFLTALDWRTDAAYSVCELVLGARTVCSPVRDVPYVMQQTERHNGGQFRNFRDSVSPNKHIHARRCWFPEASFEGNTIGEFAVIHNSPRTARTP